jgi:hypothetical protein
VWAAAATASCFVAAEESPFKAEKHDDRFVITHGGKPVATYVFRDEKILRPYFAHVYTPDGTQVTRHHPPRPGIDAVDHDTMHPGIWLAFGDLNGADSWRNKDQIKFRKSEDPSVDDGRCHIHCLYECLHGDRRLCYLEDSHSIRPLGDGYLITHRTYCWNKESAPIAFGDQEEMGLGLRLATPLVVKGGSGTITNSAGRKNEKEVWGQQADWCDYSGIVEHPHPNPLPEGEGALGGRVTVPSPFGRGPG